MNVLGKIVVPRTVATIAYIISELEEFAREEFFRLKKILEIKRRLKGDTKYKKKSPKPELVCPTCAKIKEVELLEFEKRYKVVEECIICGTSLHVEATIPEKTPEELKLEEYKATIELIVGKTKDLEEEGLITTSVQEFIKTAEKLKQKLDEQEEVELPEPIPSDVNVEHLCRDCFKRFEKEQAEKYQEKYPKPEEDHILETKELVHAASKVSFKATIEPPKQTKSLKESKLQKEPKPPREAYCELHVPSEEVELGTFESEFQEITKIIRVQNADGTITEEKKFIKIKKKVRAPIKPKPPDQDNPSSNIMFQASETSNKSNPSYSSDSKAVGIVIIRGSNNGYKFLPLQRKIKSEDHIRPYFMLDPVIRYCISFANIPIGYSHLQEIPSVLSIITNKDRNNKM